MRTVYFIVLMADVVERGRAQGDDMWRQAARDARAARSRAAMRG